jgi:hypothetical protein
MLWDLLQPVRQMLVCTGRRRYPLVGRSFLWRIIHSRNTTRSSTYTGIRAVTIRSEICHTVTSVWKSGWVRFFALFGCNCNRNRLPNKEICHNCNCNCMQPVFCSCMCSCDRLRPVATDCLVIMWSGRSYHQNESKHRPKRWRNEQVMVKMVILLIFVGCVA